MRNRSCSKPREAHCAEVSPGNELFCEEHASTPHDVHWARRRDGSQVTWRRDAKMRRRRRLMPVKVEPPPIPADHHKMEDVRVVATTSKAIRIESPDLDGEVWVPRYHINDRSSGKIVIGESITLVVTNFFARLIGLKIVKGERK